MLWTGKTNVLFVFFSSVRAKCEHKVLGQFMNALSLKVFTHSFIAQTIVEHVYMSGTVLGARL